MRTNKHRHYCPQNSFVRGIEKEEDTNLKVFSEKFNLELKFRSQHKIYQYASSLNVYTFLHLF